MENTVKKSEKETQPKYYIIKHSTEPRYYTGENKYYWKKWSLSLINVKKFFDLNEALDVLNVLNQEIINVNPNDKRKHTII